MAFQTHLIKKITPTPLGDLLLAASHQGLSGAWFVQGQKHTPSAALVATWPLVAKENSPQGNAAQTILDAASQQLTAYFLGKLTAFDLPFDLSSGTEFQQSVWREISQIHCGATTTYGSICQTIGKLQAARAVGAATGKNPISIIIPCHRVVGSTGAMTGYAGGLDRKVQLLTLEGNLRPQQQEIILQPSLH